jgi:hypothetical protein
MGISRRTLLGGGVAACLAAGGAAYELAERGLLPGKYQLARILGACGTDPPLPSVTPGRVLLSRFRSAYRRREVEMAVMLPPGPRGTLPVTLVLHGLASSARDAVTLGYPWFLAAGHLRPMALVAVDGGSATYWHPRADGDNPLGMLVHEVVPRLARQGFSVTRVGVAGWSMGGYGGLLLASALGPRRCCAAAVMSPALFTSYADAHAANPDAFDSAADFAANDVLTSPRLPALRRIPLRIDCGADDPFGPATAVLRSALGEPSGSVGSGCHDEGFWRRHIPAQLEFISAHLA